MLFFVDIYLLVSCFALLVFEWQHFYLFLGLGLALFLGLSIERGCGLQLFVVVLSGISGLAIIDFSWGFWGRLHGLLGQLFCQLPFYSK